MHQIATHRLYSQQLVNTRFDTPSDIVAWLGAVQSQDYMGAKWAIAQRTNGLTDAAVEQAFDEGSILRTHALRPTWHFLTPADIRWILALTAPRVHALNGTYYRKCELDADVFARCHTVLTNALQGHQYRTRDELATVLQSAGITTDGLRLVYIMMHAELDQLICSGPRQGKQFTYSLMDERVPPAPALSPDDALPELAYRYFSSHGPATVKDFVWWSGLTVAQTKACLNLLGLRLNHDTFAGQTYYFTDNSPTAKLPSPTAYLLPNYDEAMGSYADHSPIIENRYARLWDRKHDVLTHYLLIDGTIIGSWQRTLKKDTTIVQIKPFATLTDDQMQAITIAAYRLGSFLGLTAIIDWLPPMMPA